MKGHVYILKHDSKRKSVENNRNFAELLGKNNSVYCLRTDTLFLQDIFVSNKENDTE